MRDWEMTLDKSQLDNAKRPSASSSRKSSGNSRERHTIRLLDGHQEYAASTKDQTFAGQLIMQNSQACSRRNPEILRKKLTGQKWMSFQQRKNRVRQITFSGRASH
jgi:hypothetical protein